MSRALLTMHARNVARVPQRCGAEAKIAARDALCAALTARDGV